MKVPGSCKTSDNRGSTASISASNQSKNNDIFYLGMFCQTMKMPDGVTSGGNCKRLALALVTIAGRMIFSCLRHTLRGEDTWQWDLC